MSSFPNRPQSFPLTAASQQADPAARQAQQSWRPQQPQQGFVNDPSQMFRQMPPPQGDERAKQEMLMRGQQQMQQPLGNERTSGPGNWNPAPQQMGPNPDMLKRWEFENKLRGDGGSPPPQGPGGPVAFPGGPVAFPGGPQKPPPPPDPGVWRRDPATGTIPDRPMIGLPPPGYPKPGGPMQPPTEKYVPKPGTSVLDQFGPGGKPLGPQGPQIAPSQFGDLQRQVASAPMRNPTAANPLKPLPQPGRDSMLATANPQMRLGQFLGSNPFGR